jgi:hypothetical protein
MNLLCRVLDYREPTAFGITLWYRKVFDMFIDIPTHEYS